MEFRKTLGKPQAKPQANFGQSLGKPWANLGQNLGPNHLDLDKIYEKS